MASKYILLQEEKEEEILLVKLKKKEVRKENLISLDLSSEFLIKTLNTTFS